MSMADWTTILAMWSSVNWSAAGSIIAAIALIIGVANANRAAGEAREARRVQIRALIMILDGAVQELRLGAMGGEVREHSMASRRDALARVDEFKLPTTLSLSAYMSGRIALDEAGRLVADLHGNADPRAREMLLLPIKALNGAVRHLRSDLKRLGRAPPSNSLVDRFLFHPADAQKVAEKLHRQTDRIRQVVACLELIAGDAQADWGDVERRTKAEVARRQLPHFTAILVGIFASIEPDDKIPSVVTAGVVLGQAAKAVTEGDMQAVSAHADDLEAAWAEVLEALTAAGFPPSVTANV